MSEVPRRQGKVFDPSASAKETPQDAEQAVAAGVEVLENLQPLVRLPVVSVMRHASFAGLGNGAAM